MAKKVKGIIFLLLGLGVLFTGAFVLSIYGLQKEAHSAVQMISDDLSRDLLNSSFSSAERRIELLRRAGHYGLELIHQGEEATSANESCLSFKSFPVVVDGLQIASLSNCVASSNLGPMIIRSPVAIMVFSAAILILLLSLMMKFRFQRLQAISEKNDEIANMAFQVSHDIQSPLSVLNNLLNYIQTIPESERVLLQHSMSRIIDISNSLSLKKMPTGTISLSYLLFSEIDILINSKRLESANNKNISIRFAQKNAWNVFSNFDRTSLRRILSNLLNNSIEAISAAAIDGGLIQVTLEAENGFAKITIKDNGPGVPREIQSQLGERKISFGKERLSKSGTGLGIFHAKSTITKAGGSFSIQNIDEGGAIVEFCIPIEKRPIWFIDELMIPAHAECIVVLDDDKSIHSLWGNVLHEIKKSNAKLKIAFFTCSSDFESWAEKNSFDLLICDYKISASEINGLELIKKYDLKSKAILSTSQFANLEIQDSCVKAGIKMIPKLLIPRIKITTGSNPVHFTDNRQFVLLDDDFLVRANWEEQAKAKGKNLKSFSSSKDLFEKLSSFGKDTMFYIDNRLFQESGVEVARKIHKAGFQDLYMETADDKTLFTQYSFIRGVVGKSPVW